MNAQVFTDQSTPFKSRMEIKSESCASGIENISVVKRSYEYQVVKLLNAKREENGVPPLKLNEDMSRAARYHAKDMSDNFYFSHPSRDADSNITCETFSRMSNFFSYNQAGENIAWGYASPVLVHEAWVNSQVHYENMIHSNYREVGVGYYSSSTSLRHLWVEDFRKKNDTYPVIINKEEYQTDQLEVEIYIHGKDMFDEMRLKNEDGEWTTWQKFQSTMKWQLSGAKVCTVHVEKRKASSINSSYDDIIYTGTEIPSDTSDNSHHNDTTINNNNELLDLKPRSHGIVSLYIFPNPVPPLSGITITLNAMKGFYIYIELLDIVGHSKLKILEKKIEPGENNIILNRKNDLSPGIYFLKFSNEKFSMVRKLIVE